MQCSFVPFVSFILLHLFFVSLVIPQSEVAIVASKDNTLYEDDAGGLSNGSGAHFFTGKNSGTKIRRGLVFFDLAEKIAAGASITSVSLQLNLSRTSSAGKAVELHKVLADWGEGASDAAANEGGGGAAAASDATWLHRFFDTDLWASAGGDFSTTVSATQTVAGLGVYTWDSTEQLVADVQDWLDNPENNFGWILVGDESTAQTSKRFDSRDNPTEGNRPVLTVAFTTATSVEDKGSGPPTDFRLAQNYPNPFNPETSIEFELSRTVQVKVEIYNLLGQKVATLLNETRAAGAHELKWDGRNNLGALVAGGIYIYRLKAGDVTLSRRMLLLK